MFPTVQQHSCNYIILKVNLTQIIRLLILLETFDDCFTYFFHHSCRRKANTESITLIVMPFPSVWFCLLRTQVQTIITIVRLTI